MTLSDYGPNCLEISIYGGHSYCKSQFSHVPISNNPLALGKIIRSLTCRQCLLTPAHLSASSQTWWHMNSSSETKGAQNGSVLMGKHRTQVALTCPGQHWPLECCNCWWRNQGVPCTAPDPVSRGHNFLWVLTTPHSGKHSSQPSIKPPRLNTIWQFLSPKH